MKDSLRRLVIFVTIVGIGSAMILVNIPLIYLLILIAVVGFLLLILLGAVTVNEIKTAVTGFSLSRLIKKPASKKGEVPQAASKPPALPKEAGGKKAEKSVPLKPGETSVGIKAHITLLVSSIGSIGKILTDRSKPRKKVEDIDKLLEHTIAEKVSRSSALESAASVPAASGQPTGGPGAAGSAGSGKDVDPFLSLSGEELETGLLDGLDDTELSVPLPVSPETPAEPGSAGISLPDMDMPPLPDGDADEASAILAAHSEESGEEFSGLEGGETLNENLGELDSINLDDIDLGDDTAIPEPVPEPPARSPVAAPGAGSLVPATPITPAGSSDSGSDEHDISAFASGNAPGSDEDMLSSLATDIKQVKKEKDVSLLRELKDFKAPATDIEKELTEISEQLTPAGKGAKKST